MQVLGLILGGLVGSVSGVTEAAKWRSVTITSDVLVSLNASEYRMFRLFLYDYIIEFRQIFNK